MSDETSQRKRAGEAGSKPKAPGGWLDRRTTMVPVLAAAGFLGLLQASLLVWRNQAFPGGLAMVLGMARLGLIAGFITLFLLIPAVLLLRRLHPDWSRGNRQQASWSVCMALAAGVGAWMIADVWFAGPLVPKALRLWMALAVALGVAFIASFLYLPKRFLQIAALGSVVLLVLALLPIGPGSSPESAGSERVMVSARSGTPDVILVSIDTLRADRLGTYGRSPSITPMMDLFAKEGVVFGRALAASPWTVPSVASMLTGLPTVRHGCGLPLSSGFTFLRSPLEDKFTTLAERFSAAGYRTRAVVANGFLAPEMGMAQGFQYYENPFGAAMAALIIHDLPLGRLLLCVVPVESWGDYRAEGVTEQALAWLAEDGQAPLFLWVHYIDPHTPYQADPRSLDLAPLMEEIRQTQPQVLDDGTVVGEAFAATSAVRSGLLWLGPEDRRRIEDYYDRGVKYADEQIGRLLAVLRERAADREVIVALTADHGEEFWDHGQFEHGHDYYREVTQVPLVFWGPGLIPAERRVQIPVGLVDVGPTLLELAGLEVAVAELADEGRSLQALWKGETGEEKWQPPRFSGGNLYELPAVLVEDGPWRYILRANDSEELYDVTRDPRERHNRLLEHPEVASRYRELLQPRLSVFLKNADDEGLGLSPETLKALRSLGYVQ